MACNCCGGPDWVPLFSEGGRRLGRCPQCDLHFIEFLPSAEAHMTEMEGGHFTGRDKAIDAKRQKASERALSSHFMRFVNLARAHAQDGRWLDIGCGAGTLLSFSQAAGFEVEGIELTRDRLEAASAAGFTVHGSPVEDLGLPAESFDVISLINVFSHLTDPASTLSELKRLLRPGGVILLATGLLGTGVKKSDVPHWNLGDHLFFLGDRTMPVYCARIGLEIVERQSRWLPDEVYSREWLNTTGGSRTRDAVKKTIDTVPGFYPAYRGIMMRRSRGNSVYSVAYALTRPE